MGQKRASRALSPRTVWVIERIHESRGRVLRSLGVSDLFAEVGQSGEPRGLLYVREALLDRRSGIREAAAAAAFRLIEAVVPHDWVWLDDTMRSGYLGGVAVPYGKWRDLKPIRLSSAASKLNDPRPLILIATMHPNGFIRQAALEAASDRPNSFLLPAVLLRLRDWVPEVRSVARRVWTQLLPLASSQDLLHLVPLATHLKPLDPTEELTEGLALLTKRLEEGQGAALRLGLEAPDPATRRHCFRTLLDLGAMEPSKIFKRGLGDADPVVQYWAVSEALRAIPVERQSHYLRMAAKHGRSRVRLQALSQLWQTDGAECRDALEHALTARAASVRGFAQWALGQLGTFDAAAFYRAQLRSATGRSLAAAILELGRWGSPADANTLAPFFDQPNPPRIIGAAIRALARLDPELARPRYERALLADSRRVARAARDLIASDLGFPACAKAREWAVSAPNAHSRLYAVTILMRRCSKWPRLIALLELVLGGDEALTDVARRAVGQWVASLNRSTASPSSDEADRVEWLVTRLANGLPEEWSREIRFALP